MRTTLKHIWKHLSTHGWPLLAGGFLCGFAAHHTSSGDLWCAGLAIVGIILTLPPLVADILEISHWRERH